MRGRPVILPEVAAFADPGCRWCHGKGSIVVIVHAPPRGRQARLCGCAEKRFAKLARERTESITIDGEVRVFWLRSCEPENWEATQRFATSVEAMKIRQRASDFLAAWARACNETQPTVRVAT